MQIDSSFALKSSPLLRKPKLAAPSSEPPVDSTATSASEDKVELSKPGLFNTSNLLKAAKWGAIGAAAGALPFVLGAKVGAFAALGSTNSLFDSITEKRSSITRTLLAGAAATAVCLGIGIAGAHLGAFNDGFTLQSALTGAALLAPLTAGASLAGDAVKAYRETS